VPNIVAAITRDTEARRRLHRHQSESIIAIIRCCLPTAQATVFVFGVAPRSCRRLPAELVRFVGFKACLSRPSQRHVTRPQMPPTPPPPHECHAAPRNHPIIAPRCSSPHLLRRSSRRVRTLPVCHRTTILARFDLPADAAVSCLREQTASRVVRSLLAPPQVSL
jgi:hypothetical protein